ncbi:Putative DNA-binding domain-containing protein [Williamsia sterculiae]|uniref:Putative DNA-binding domain-containing protein n=2 Tax=Williamsia sterculiae TaxID=1344003 RepID=A0A1N7HDT4_9NOCA|nr:Putative DNA-binding domain-containing protein [Williamsia sterculiae]
MPIHPGRWAPATEQDLREAAANGLLEETHYLDLKRELKPGPSGNKEIAKDIAAFALDGGTILIGIDEDTTPPSLYPVPLDGLAERIEQVGLTRVDEPVQVRCRSIPSADDATLGSLVVEVAASARAPHMTDGRFYGRGDKTNRPLHTAEVERLLTSRRANRADALARAWEIHDDISRTGLMVATAEPLTTTQDNPLEALSADDDWINQLNAIRTSSTVREHQNFAPNLSEAIAFQRRASGVALTRGMYSGRFLGGSDAAELVFEESGRLALASDRAVTTFKPRPSDEAIAVMLEAVILGQVDFLVRAAAQVATRYHFGASWRFCLVVADTHDAIAYTSVTHGFSDGPPYTSNAYERVADASLADMTDAPTTIVDKLTAPLLRGLASRFTLGQ